MKRKNDMQCSHFTFNRWISICLTFGFYFFASGQIQAKDLDPALTRFLAPSMKYAFGLRVTESYWNTYVERLGRDPVFVQTYSDKSKWYSANPKEVTFRQSAERRINTLKDTKHIYIFTLFMLMQSPLAEKDIPEALRKKYPKDPASLEAAADGMYDAQWEWLGKRLAQCSQQELDRLVLRPGHEMNGGWYKHSTKPRKFNPALADKYPLWYKTYWQRIHKAVTKGMGSKRVLWNFCPSGGQIHSASTPPEVGNAYPGDEYVDIIGIDRYAGNVDAGDAGKGSWEEARTSAFAWLSRFAAEHGKMTAVDETGITWVPNKKGGKKGGHYGSDDYPEWFEGLAKWMQQEVDARRLHHVTLFERDTSAKFHACVIREKPIPGREKQALNYPKSAAKIIELWGGKLK